MTKPILDGHIRDPELDLELSTGSADPNSRKMLARELDAAEMSIATCVQMASLGRPFTGVSVFMARRFLQSCVVLAPNSPIRTPAQLRGARIVIPQYWVTSSMWHRLLLTEAYGVAIEDVTWLTVMPERLANSRAGVNCTYIGERPIDDVLMSGDADVAFEPRPRARGGNRLLFPDPAETALEYFRETGVYPLIHTIGVQSDLAAQYPDVPRRLFKLFERAKEWAYANLQPEDFESPIAGMSFDRARSHVGADPYPYGISANRKAIEAFLRAAYEQGLSENIVTPEDIFQL